MHFADLDQKIAPLLVVEREQSALLRLLCDSQVTHAVRVVAPLEVTEVGRREELVFVARLVLELFPDEDVLFVQGISFAERLCEGGEKVRELIVAVNVCAVFLHGVLYFQDSRIFARLGIEHAHAVRLFHGKIDVLKDTLALASGTERIDRQGHAGTQGDKK